MKKVLTLMLVLMFVVTICSCDIANIIAGKTTTTTATSCKHDNPEKIVIVEGKASSCQETGLTEGMKCTLCGTMVVPQAVVGTIDCIEGDWIVDEEATTTEEGLMHTECTMCGKKMSEEIIYHTGSEGLKFTLNDDGVSYSLSSRGDCSDSEIVIPKYYMGLPVTSIGDYAFQHCTSLTSIEIPDSIESIGKYAFYNTTLTSVEIADSVTSIGTFAFNDCTYLTSIKIPDSVTNIGSAALSNCALLTSIEVDTNNQYYKSIDGNLYTKDGNMLVQYAIGKDATSFAIPDSVTSIGSSAFAECQSLTSIKIPDSVTSIGMCAFDGCISLTSIEISNSVTSIDHYAFDGCISLTSIEIPDSVTSIGYAAFGGCTCLTIYCGAKSTPSGWDSDWNYSNCPVVWDYKGN